MVDEVMNNRTIRFPNSLEKRIEKASDDFSEFVRQACIEKLARKIKEDKSYPNETLGIYKLRVILFLRS